MALTKLPPELLESIIIHAVPEGFESLAVTCKRIHALCIPFFEHHNVLNSRFRHFVYGEGQFEEPFRTIVTAGELIRRIAAEPVIARYIRSADLRLDSPRSYIFPHYFIRESEDCQEDVQQLFASCAYLKRAGLDWEDYLEKIEDEFDNIVYRRPRYSQYAAAFLLTLLPNVEKLILPRYWRKLDDTEKLVDAIRQTAEESSSHMSCNRSSLARVTRFEHAASLVPQDHFNLDLTKPFLALPRVRSFRGPSCVACNEMNTTSKTLSYVFGQTLESISFEFCCLDEKAIAKFLKDTSRLRTFRYSHSTKTCIGPQPWDICTFIAAVERRVGSQLEELSLSVRDPAVSVAPGNTSLRNGFPHLRQLEIPLEVVMCNITANESTGGASPDVALSIGDLVPASVSILSLISSGKTPFDQALEILFQDFVVKKESVLPALKEIHLICPNNADIKYKEYCEELRLEAQKVGVVLHL
ncbi:hypothetical protein ACLMJK_005682 [Lecanora helva]